MDDVELVESTVQRCRRCRAIEAQAVVEQRRVAQTCAEPVVLDTVFGEIEQAVAIEQDTPPDEYRSPVEFPVVDRQPCLDRRVIAERAFGQAVDEIACVEFAQNSEHALAIGDAEGGNSLLPAADKQAALPCRPGAIAAQARLVGPFDTQDAGNRPALACADIGGQVEIVPVRLCVQQQGQGIVRAELRIAIDEQEPVTDLDFGSKIHAL